MNNANGETPQTGAKVFDLHTGAPTPESDAAERYRAHVEDTVVADIDTADPSDPSAAADQTTARIIAGILGRHVQPDA